jgi:hypothetical protein
MSKDAPTKNVLSIEEVPDMATRYLEASDGEPERQEQFDEIADEIKELESTREELAQDIGEEHYLVEDIDADIQELEDERDEIRDSTENIAQLRKNLLRAASEKPGFRLNEYWLNSETSRAITKALYGTENEKLVIGDQELRTPDDAQGLDRMQKIQIKREMVHLARDKLDGDKHVTDRWEEFKNRRGYQAFPVIAHNPGVGPSEIAEAYDDKSPSTVRDWTSDLSNQEELKMVFTPKQGKYHLSTVGRYYAAHYAELDGAETMDEAEGDKHGFESGEEAADESATATTVDEDEDTEQVGLGNSNEVPEDEPNGSVGAGQAVTVSEAQTTEEKAEALFEDVSETQRTNE